MSLTLRNSFGYTEAVIVDNGGLKQFYFVSDILSQELDIIFLQKEDEFDSIDWQFKFGNQPLTLHYNIYNGISIFPSNMLNAGSKGNKAVAELAGLLEQKIFNQEKRSIA